MLNPYSGEDGFSSSTIIRENLISYIYSLKTKHIYTCYLTESETGPATANPNNPKYPNKLKY